MRTSTKHDDSEWEQEATKVEVTKPASIVYSVRFSPEELGRIRSIAKARNVKAGELIRESTLQHLREPENVDIAVAAPSADKVVYIGDRQKSHGMPQTHTGAPRDERYFAEIKMA